MEKTSAIPYRPEIDGLRAVSVLAVIFFHARIGAPGGYVGVDVFFVISGYLITSLIRRDLRNSSFSALNFWERRIRRIAPAFVVTTAAILVAAWFLYLPEDFERVGEAVIAQSLFGSNIYHWMVSGYFGREADTLPLLHTWSLAVEEQYYILLPVFLLLIWFLRPAWIFPALLGMFCLSFGLGTWMTPRYETAAFFLLPTRAWELLLGSLLACDQTGGIQFPRWLKNATSLLGLCAIAYAVLFFNAQTPFPGVCALIPCLGTAAFLWGNQSCLTPGGWLLSRRPFIFTGQISYSFYLVHWPLLVFPLYWFRTEITTIGKLGLIVTAFVAAVISWAVIETPVRKKWIFRRRLPLFLVTACSILLLLACGQLVKQNKGFPTRLSFQALEYAAAQEDHAFINDQSIARIVLDEIPKFGAAHGTSRCLIWGDSHAMALIPALDAVCREKNISGIQMTRSSTAPLLKFLPDDLADPMGNPREWNSRVVEMAIARKVQTVVIAGRWSSYDNAPQFEKCVKETIQTIVSAGMTAVIVRDVPMHVDDVPRLLVRTTFLGLDPRNVGLPLEKHRQRNSRADAVFEKVSGPHVIVLDPTSYFMEGQSQFCRGELDETVLYRDSQHLTVRGALRLVPMFEPIFEAK